MSRNNRVYNPPTPTPGNPIGARLQKLLLRRRWTDSGSARRVLSAAGRIEPGSFAAVLQKGPLPRCRKICKRRLYTVSVCKYSAPLFQNSKS